MTPLSPPPAFPTTALRLLTICGEEDFSLSELVHVVEADPAISSRLLRLANSAYYGFSRKIGTLDTAVQALGKITVQALALGHSILKLWGDSVPPPSVEALWVHAYRCALGCRHLGNRLPRDPHLSHPDTLFLIGLLHDIGKILFLVREPDPYLRALGEDLDRESFLAWEKSKFGSDHAEAGGGALESWQLPLAIASVVRYHHRMGLRTELQSDWVVLRTVDDLAAGLKPGVLETPFPQGLLADLAPQLDRFDGEARTFFRAIQ